MKTAIALILLFGPMFVFGIAYVSKTLIHLWQNGKMDWVKWALAVGGFVWTTTFLLEILLFRAYLGGTGWAGSNAAGKAIDPKYDSGKYYLHDSDGFTEVPYAVWIFSQINKWLVIAVTIVVLAVGIWYVWRRKRR